MKPYYQDNLVTVYHGNCLEVLPQLSGITCVVTDPPYELGFMGKAWDSQGVSFQPNTWKLVSDSCKSGAMMLSFGGTRTWHRIAVAIEDAGWEIRDTLCWLYGQGFPKSLDISKAIDKMKGAEREVIGNDPFAARRNKTTARFNGEVLNYGGDNQGKSGTNLTAPATPEAQLWSGYGTALKPAFEPIILAMKPLDGTFANNALKHGVAGLNIDGSRIGYQSDDDKDKAGIGFKGAILKPEDGWNSNKVNRTEFDQSKGRFPANVILDEEAGQVLDEQSGTLKSGDNCIRTKVGSFLEHGGLGKVGDAQTTYGDSGGASRFFYCAKADKKERNKGCEELEERNVSFMNTHGGNADKGETWHPVDDRTGKERDRFSSKSRNDHPTVKPLALMKYLCNLIKPPADGVLLDPFMGSGSTLIAARELGIKCIGIELDERACEIATKRMSQGVMWR